MTTDPVCSMNVDETRAPAKTTHEGRTYYFCSDQCKAEFEKNPEKYANQPSPAK